MIPIALALAAGPALAQNPIRVRGLHGTMGASDIDVVADFIRNELRAEGVNTLVWEINYTYQFNPNSQFQAWDAVSWDQVRQILAACQEAGIELIPQFQSFGHQSWYDSLARLLEVRPDLDARPGVPVDYCRSWNPLHPELHPIVFSLMDQVADATGATSFHLGMDEVFMMPEDGTPYYQGQSWAQMFADEVETYRQHLASRVGTFWLWGDRLLDADTFGTNWYEGNGPSGLKEVHGAIDSISPAGLIIADWHYDNVPKDASGVSTGEYFASRGFDVVSSPWLSADVAREQLDIMRNADASIAPHMLGMLQTSWGGSLADFARAYRGDISIDFSTRSADCFKQLFAAIRATGDLKVPGRPAAVRVQ